MNQSQLNIIVGKNIKKYRLLYNESHEKLTQEKLAEAINVSVSTISNLESNKIKKGISIKNLYKISIILDTPINKFLRKKMIDKYIINSNLNNISDILSFKNNDKFKKLLNRIDINDNIIINSHLIHKSNYINGIEQFLFNLDNYITFVKNNLNINQLELRYIIDLTLYNKYNKTLFSNYYFYDYMDYYKNNFIKMFMYNYNNNIIFLKKYMNIKHFTFNELIDCINSNKKRSYAFFEIINEKNMNFYIPIIESLLHIN